MLTQQVTGSDLLAVKLKKLDLMAAQKIKELDGYERFRMKLYEAMADELIDQDEYRQMRKKYSQLIGRGIFTKPRLDESISEISKHYRAEAGNRGVLDRPDICTRRQADLY